ncbi:MAG: hypothetical protein VX113_09600, partial [Pseudomonadota bacterium]|nr:hypothetical protein [Pseudomonadota bacterium]
MLIRKRRRGRETQEVPRRAAGAWCPTAGAQLAVRQHSSSGRSNSASQWLTPSRQIPSSPEPTGSTGQGHRPSSGSSHSGSSDNDGGSAAVLTLLGETLAAAVRIGAEGEGGGGDGGGGLETIGPAVRQHSLSLGEAVAQLAAAAPET